MTAAELAPAVPVADAEEEARARRARRERLGRWALPVAFLCLAILVWDLALVVTATPHYIMPRPALVIETLVKDWGTLSGSFLITLRVTFQALALAVLGGVGLAVLFSLSRAVELALYPYAVILQVTPIVAIAPLLLIHFETGTTLLIVAWIVAFFPILSNTTLGLRSADHNLRDLFAIYRASRLQRLLFLELPSALPFFLGGLRIGGGLALIGAVVGEFAAGTAGRASGLAFRILESNYRLNIPRMFAALLLVIATGLAIFLAFSLLSHLLLRRWHESAVKREV